MPTRTAIVTGGLTGIGLAAAKTLKDKGHHVAVCGRRGDDPDLITDVRRAIGDDAFIGVADVRDQDSVDGFVSQVRDALGPPLILVNAAGVYHESFLDGPDDSTWFDQIDINLNGPYRMIRAVYPDMKQAGWGRIANIASTAGAKGAAGYAGYCASKAGVIGLSKSVAVEGAPYGISCISLSPTWVETPMMDNAVQRIARAKGAAPQNIRDAMNTTNPQNRLVQPSEIAAVVGFFCSNEAPAMTNVDIQINAGADW